MASPNAPRIRLTPFFAEHWLDLIESEVAFTRSFGHSAAAGLREFMLGPEVSQAWLAQLKVSKGADPWRFGFAVIDLGSDTVIGIIGFKGPPDSQGVVEIAYGIVPSFQGRGFATEAVALAMDFAVSVDAVRLVRAHTLPTKNASTRVLEKCGFQQVGSVVDPDDGPVLRWERARRDNR